MQNIPGMSIRSDCGNGRISYNPDWSKEKPFQIYYKGTAVNSSHSLGGAIQNLTTKGCHFTNREFK